MEYAVPVRIEYLGGGEGYAATSESFPGFLAHGKTLEETVRKADLVLKSLLETYRDHGVKPPAEAKKVKKVEINIALPFEISEGKPVSAC